MSPQQKGTGHPRAPELRGMRWSVVGGGLTPWATPSTCAQVAFGHDTVRTPYDEEEADRQYLMGIYDAENLIHDILKYLQSGTLLLKHGRNCKPHFRKFWISDDTKQLCWCAWGQGGGCPVC